MSNFASMKELSILIPVYGENILWQVKLLYAQCSAIKDLSWEIVVAEDGRPQQAVYSNTDGLSQAHFIADGLSDGNNDEIAAMAHCRLIKREKNGGRAAIRNFLAREARFDNLLYIDAGLKPNPHFVENYVDNIGKSLVVCGNIAVDKACINMENLRCRNELRAQKRFTAAKHAIEPYKNFHTTAFMIDRCTMLANPMREDIRTYGYEDTLFGKQLADKHVSIRHIDNPVLFTAFESNSRYLEKTKEAMYTLYNYREELEHYSPLLHVVHLFQKLHLLWLPIIIDRCFVDKIVDNLTGRHPNLQLYSLFRVCLLAKKYAQE